MLLGVIGPAAPSGTSTAFRSLLLPGERLLWEGRPDVNAFSLRGAWFLVPFSILWGGFALFWEASVLTSPAPGFFALWGIPFVLAGLYLIFGRIPVARREARRTRYAITDRRLLLLRGPFGQQVTEIDLKDVPPPQLERGRSGIGTITFGPTPSAFRAPPGWPTLGMYAQPPAFLTIPDADRVSRVLQDARA
jgi:hypothetical protein